MPESVTTYPQWKAPSADEGTLIWPEPARLLRETTENHARLKAANAPRLQGVTLSDLRQGMRAWIGHTDDAQPLIATGHQTELIHPGVWAKNVLLNAAMHKLGGEAYFFAVDTDAPKHLHLRWPGGSIPITDDPNLATATWSGQLESPTPAHVREMASRVEEASRAWPEKPDITPIFDSLRRLSLESLPLSSALTNAMHELEWSLGLRHHAMPTSPLLYAEPYLVFAHHLLANAARFAWQYNTALSEYRRMHRLRSNVRPMPDLATSHGECETPFWLDHLDTGERDRAAVVRAGDRWALRLRGGDEFAFDEKADGWPVARELAGWLRSRHLRLSPRAITLTMFIRLFIADQFVHGIGGGRYDQVTDRLIATHFRLPPPKFSVTTATLYFPGAADRTRACVPCIEQQGHHLRHDVLGEEKRALVAQIEAAPRYSMRRRELFTQLHRRLAEASRDHPELERWREQLEQARRLADEESALFDRELFFAIQPRDRLESLIRTYFKTFE